MKHEYEIRQTGMIVIPKGEPLFSEMGTEVLIVDEAAGEYVEVIQHGRSDTGKICITPEEWSILRKSIDYMIKQCREESK